MTEMYQVRQARHRKRNTSCPLAHVHHSVYLYTCVLMREGVGVCRCQETSDGHVREQKGGGVKEEGQTW